MNVDTGEIRRIAIIGAGPDPVNRENLRRMMEEGFVPVPDELAEEANSILGDNDSAFADMTADTPLINWAKTERRHRKNTRKAKMAKASRRRNRSRA